MPSRVLNYHNAGLQSAGCRVFYHTHTHAETFKAKITLDTSWIIFVAIPPPVGQSQSSVYSTVTFMWSYPLFDNSLMYLGLLIHSLNTRVSTLCNFVSLLYKASSWDLLLPSPKCFKDIHFEVDQYFSIHILFTVYNFVILIVNAV